MAAGSIATSPGVGAPKRPTLSITTSLEGLLDTLLEEIFKEGGTAGNAIVLTGDFFSDKSPCMLQISRSELVTKVYKIAHKHGIIPSAVILEFSQKEVRPSPKLSSDDTDWTKKEQESDMATKLIGEVLHVSTDIESKLRSGGLDPEILDKMEKILGSDAFSALSTYSDFVPGANNTICNYFDRIGALQKENSVYLGRKRSIVAQHGAVAKRLVDRMNKNVSSINQLKVWTLLAHRIIQLSLENLSSPRSRAPSADCVIERPHPIKIGEGIPIPEHTYKYSSPPAAVKHSSEELCEDSTPRPTHRGISASAFTGGSVT